MSSDTWRAMWVTLESHVCGTWQAMCVTHGMPCVIMHDPFETYKYGSSHSVWGVARFSSLEQQEEGRGREKRKGGEEKRKGGKERRKEGKEKKGKKKIEEKMRGKEEKERGKGRSVA